MLARYRQQMRADFWQYYGRDLMDIGRGRMGPAETHDLVLGLMDRDSATARTVNEGPVWGVAEYLAADQVEALTGKPHPARPKKSSLSRRANDPAFRAARERALARKRAREEAIREGRIK